MILKSSSIGRMRLLYLALIPLLALVVYSCTCNKKGEKQEASPAEEVTVAEESSAAEAVGTEPATEVATDAVSFDALEVKPTFRGGDANEFSKWVNENMTYPEEAITAGDQGRVLLGFCINTDGTMSDIRILRGVSPALDAEALRVLNSCTEKWTPGQVNGQPVKVNFTFPIVFQLK